MQGNAPVLREAIANLIDNAIRYTGRGAIGDGAGAPLGPDAQIEVEDDGPGIAPADRERFERFARATLQGDGCGPGASRSSGEIAERHGGRVALEGVAARPARIACRGWRLDLRLAPDPRESPG